jgi:DNA-binding IclR family transcriptional regulator
MESDEGDAVLTHRTVDRVTRILEEVVYNPGVTFSELVRSLGAAKSSVHGFMRGLLAKGWLYEDNGRLYLGPAVHGLTLASGHIRAGVITHADLTQLHQETDAAVFVGVQAGDHLIYIAEEGSDPVTGFDARTNIRRPLLDTAGGKVLLAVQPDAVRESFLRRLSAAEPDLVSQFLDEYQEIQRTGLATNIRRNGKRFAIATAIKNSTGAATASMTLVGPTTDLQPKSQLLGEILLRRADEFKKRTAQPREAI